MWQPAARRYRRHRQRGGRARYGAIGSPGGLALPAPLAARRPTQVPGGAIGTPGGRAATALASWQPAALDGVCERPDLQTGVQVAPGRSVLEPLPPLRALQPAIRALLLEGPLCAATSTSGHAWAFRRNQRPAVPAQPRLADAGSPLAVYQTAKARGMDLVAIHGSRQPRRRPRAAEPSAGRAGRDPGRRGVLLAARSPGRGPFRRVGDDRDRAPRAAAARGRTRSRSPRTCGRAGIFFCASTTRSTSIADRFDARLRYLALVDAAPAVETRNGAMLPAHNALAEGLGVGVRRAARRRQRRPDTFCGASAATSWTDARGPGRAASSAAASTCRRRPGPRRRETRAGRLPLAADIYGRNARDHAR